MTNTLRNPWCVPWTKNWWEANIPVSADVLSSGQSPATCPNPAAVFVHSESRAFLPTRMHTEICSIHACMHARNPTHVHACAPLHKLSSNHQGALVSRERKPRVSEAARPRRAPHHAPSQMPCHDLPPQSPQCHLHQGRSLWGYLPPRANCTLLQGLSCL